MSDPAAHPPSDTSFQHPVTNREALGSPETFPNLEVTSREISIEEIDASRLDPNYSYRLARKNRKRVARLRMRGYIIVDSAKEVIYNPLGEPVEPAEDGTYTFGDTVLMKIAKREHKQRRIAQRRKTEERLRGPRRKFKSKARGMKDRAGQSIEVITNKEPGDKGSQRRRR